MGALSFWHLIIIVIVIVLLFGTGKLRNLGSDLGSAIKGFKKAMEDEDKKPEQPSNLSQQTDKQESSVVDKDHSDTNKPS